MARTFSFDLTNGLTAINGAPTGATADKIMIAQENAVSMVSNPAYESPEPSPGAPAPANRLKF